MRVFFPALLILALSFQQAMPGEPEFVAVPAEATVRVVDENYSVAREKAVRKAFGLAVYLAVAGIVPPAEFDRNGELIAEYLVSRGVDFVSSYKFLDETIDHAEGTLTARLQVTLFLNSIRKTLSKNGVKTKKRSLPKLAIIIKEQNAGFMSETNFLLFTSLTEEVLVKNFRQRGFLVADRNDARKARIESFVLRAIGGDGKAAAKVGRALEADLLILGKTEVNVGLVPEGENVEVIITVTLRRMPDGAALLEKMETGSGVYDEVLSGSLETIQSTAHIIARDLAVAVAGKWKDLKERSDG